MSYRQLFDVSLRPTQGSRFAPTGFPDLGTAEFDRPTEDGWERCILAESAQSMANRLEGTLWDDAADAPVDLIARLPYVRVFDNSGAYITSSRTESHRLASPYVRKASSDGRIILDLLVSDVLNLAENTPLDYHAMARALLAVDPLVLVHGVFFAGQGAKEFPGQPKFVRAVTGFIEAIDVRRADSGGVKRDHVSHDQKESGGSSDEGFGSIPFSRTEWTARSIVASFNIDLAQVHSYGLPEPAEELVIALARYEIAALLAGSLRLRTNCDLEVAEPEIIDREGTKLPAADEQALQIAALIDRCAEDGLLGDRGVIEATWTKKGK